ncbi:MAG TPA: type II toxin-antitoxin system RelE/ParE family toxin [Novosphingobium sp.]|nr:type II toxin-antitoxin system RelE/ParE family toxin [Novosphingobium sp.]
MPFVGFAFTETALDFLDSLPPKIRRQVIRKAKALHANPHPPGSKKLKDVETADGEAVYRERAGDYRILYVVRDKPAEVIITDIDHRKEVYRMPNTKTKPADEMRMSESDFDTIMSKALGVPAPLGDAANDKPKRLSAYPKKPKAEG